MRRQLFGFDPTAALSGTAGAARLHVSLFQSPHVASRLRYSCVPLPELHGDVHFVHVSLVVFGFNGYYHVLLEFIYFFSLAWQTFLQSFIEFNLIFHVLLGSGFTRFYLVAPDFNGFYWTSLSFTS